MGLNRKFDGSIGFSCVVLAWVVLCFCTLTPVLYGAEAANGQILEQSIELPAGELMASLDTLAKQSGLEFVYNPDQLRGIQSPRVAGRMTPEQAVVKLLEGTNLRLIEHPNGALLIAAPDAQLQISAKEDQGPEANGIVAGHRSGSAEVPGDGHRSSTRESLLNEIIVTGTHIRGETPVGSSLSVYTRAQMEQTGSATLEQFGRKMPENYAATDALSTVNTNGGVGSFQQGTSNNVFGGASFNLKGLGPGSTLTLLNGHRLAGGGLDGSIVDISQIPMSAINHIDVLGDGASAIYGADAVAGVVNIITRHEFDGAETGLRFGRSTQGGAGEYTASQMLGRTWQTGDVLLDYEYDDQEGLDASQRAWIGPQDGAYSLIPENRRNSIYFASSEDIGPASTFSADGLYSDRHFQSNGVSTNLLSPVGPLQSSGGHVSQTAVSLSFSQKFWNDWNATVTGSYSSIRQREDIRSVGGVALPSSSDIQRLVADSSVAGFDTIVSGSLVDFVGEPVKGSLGASFRSERFQSSELNTKVEDALSRGRQVSSAYAELIVPVLENGGIWKRHLEFSLAYRYDYYSDFYSTTNPKFGWLWEPAAGLRLKGTAGTSYKAPLVSQLASPITAYTALFPGGNGQGGTSDALIINGGNAQLQPEISTSVTFGIDYQPPEVRGLQVSMDYSHIRYKNRIQAQNIQAGPILSQSQLFAITGIAPGMAYVQPYFGSPGFQGDFAGRGPGRVDYVVDNQVANTASTIESVISFSSRCRWSTEHGQVDFSLYGIYLLADRIRTAIFVPEFNVDNTIGEPPKFKARGAVDWTKDDLSFGFTLNYVNAYQNTLFSPSQPIGSWTTADLFLGYDTGVDSLPVLANLLIGLSVQNVFNARPPYLQIPAADLAPGRNAIPFDGTNASPVGRFISLHIRKSW